MTMKRTLQALVEATQRGLREEEAAAATLGGRGASCADPIEAAAMASLLASQPASQPAAVTTAPSSFVAAI
uniref:Uncharacterized protein n=1 Tax=Oryza punctata TaxID=4537 RepID=A0A0E0KDM7_ORYPU